MTLTPTLESERRTFAGPFGEITVHVHRGPDTVPGACVFFGGARAVGERAARLAQDMGCTLLAVDSALSLAPAFPQSVDEAYFITCTLHEHADELGLDHRHLAVAGEGLGAALATTVARLAKERRNPALVLQLLIAPVLDLRTPCAALEPLVQRYLPSASDREDPRASPVLAKNLIGLPPALVLAPNDDSQHAAACAYVEALRRAHVEVTLDSSADPSAVLRTHAAALQRALGKA